MAYTSPTSINASRFASILEYVNEVTDFWVSRMLMIAIFVIFTVGYMKSKDDDFVGGIAVGSYATFVIGLLFWLIGFLDGITMGFILGATIISTVILMVDKRGQ